MSDVRFFVELAAYIAAAALMARGVDSLHLAPWLRTLLMIAVAVFTTALLREAVRRDFAEGRPK